LYSKWR